MKMREVLDEGLIDRVKAALGAAKGTVVASVTSLLAAFKKSPSVRLTTIEKFKVAETGKEYLARVDTGALVCSINATDIEIDVEAKKIKFKHGGRMFDEPLLRMKTVTNSHGAANRPRVSWTYEWNGKKYFDIETSLADRSKLKFELLIGRNLIRELKLPVHISDQEAGD